MTNIPPVRPKTTAPSRVTVLAGLLIAGLAVLEWCLIHLQVLRHEDLEENAEKYRFWRQRIAKAVSGVV